MATAYGDLAGDVIHASDGTLRPDGSPMGKVEPHCLGKRTKISADFEHSVVATPIPVMNIVITNFHSPPIFYVSTRTGWHAISR